MITVDVVFRYGGQPTEQAALALAHARDVYGIRSLELDRTASTIRIEYDATRLNEAAVGKLVRRAGLEIVDPLPIARPDPAQPSTSAA